MGGANIYPRIELIPLIESSPPPPEELGARKNWTSRTVGAASSSRPRSVCLWIDRPTPPNPAFTTVPGPDRHKTRNEASGIVAMKFPTTKISIGGSTRNTTPPPESDCVMEDMSFVRIVNIEKNVQTTIRNMNTSENEERVLEISVLGCKDDIPHKKTTPSLENMSQQTSEKITNSTPSKQNIYECEFKRGGMCKGEISSDGYRALLRDIIF